MELGILKTMNRMSAQQLCMAAVGCIAKVGILGTLLNIIGLILIAGVLFPVGIVLAQEDADEEEYPLVYETWQESSDDVMELWEAGTAYEVQPGDSLWRISEKLWGDGQRYRELISANQNISETPDLIYPGMRLETGRRGYITRKEAKYGGLQMGNYSLDIPGGWTVGTLSSGAASANLVLSGEGAESIACLIQDKKKETVLTAQDWEACQKRIRDHVDRNYQKDVSDLSFEHYHMKDGEELYLYSFHWQIDLPETEQSMRIPVCVGMKLTEHMQAEFLGFGGSYDIHGGVRYVAASFKEHAGYDPEVSSVNDSNMAILPETQWEMKGMLDPFSWVDEFFAALLEKPEPESLREGMIGQISRPGGRRE